jgi:2-methylcitrate dehydratase PrpD
MEREELTEEIARFTTNATFDALGDRVVEQAKRVLVDTVGVTIGAARTDLANALKGYLAATGGHTTVAAGGIGPETIALVSGTLGHALDYDDVLLMMPGHPSAVVLSAVLAVAHDRPLTGQELILAYVIGVEVAATVGQALGHGHYARGWHASGTASAFGAAAACAVRLGLDESQVRSAIGIVASSIGGLQRNFGSMTKPLHSGLAARAGVTAAQLAGQGFTANQNALGGRLGFLAVYGGGGSEDHEIRWLGRPFVVDEPGIALKKYPCCGGAHRAIDGVLDMRREAEQRSERIVELSCAVPRGGLQALQYHSPVDGLEAKFSMEYCLAAAAIDGEVSLASFHDSQVNRPDVRDLILQTEVTDQSPDVQVGSNDEIGLDGFVRVSCVTDSGAKLSRDVKHAAGSPHQPMTWDEIDEKFMQCVGEGGHDPASLSSLLRGLREMETMPDARVLLPWMLSGVQARR